MSRRNSNGDQLTGRSRLTNALLTAVARDSAGSVIGTPRHEAGESRRAVRSSRTPADETIRARLWRYTAQPAGSEA